MQETIAVPQPFTMGERADRDSENIVVCMDGI